MLPQVPVSTLYWTMIIKSNFLISEMSHLSSSLFILDRFWREPFVISFIFSFFLSSSALLDALTKNGSSASNGAYRRRPAESSQSNGGQPETESQESGGGDSSKGFTKEQVEGVQRWEFSILFMFYCVYPTTVGNLPNNWPCVSSSVCIIHD